MKGIATKEAGAKSKNERRKTVLYRRVPGTPLTSAQRANIDELARMPDHKIDTSDIPELPLNAWRDAARGKLYRPVKQAVSLRVDADVMAWLKESGRGYQTRANKILREKMLADRAG